MLLNELRKAIVEGEIVNEEEETEFEEADTEIDLQNALLLLQDVASLLGAISSKGIKSWNRSLTNHMGRQIVKMGQEIENFLSDFDMGSDDDPANQRKVA